MHPSIENFQFKRLNKTDLFSLNHFLKQYKEPKVGKGDLAYWLKQVGSHEQIQEHIQEDNQSSTPRNKILGCARLIPLQAQASFWLRGVFIEPSCREQGLGTVIMQKLHASIKQEHEKVLIYAFPLGHLQHFYENVGYQLISKEALPAELKQKFESAEQQNKGWLCMSFCSQAKN